MKINNHKVEMSNESFGSTITIDDTVKLYQTTKTAIFGNVYGDEELKIAKQTFPNLVISEDDGYRRHLITDKNIVTA